MLCTPQTLTKQPSTSPATNRVKMERAPAWNEEKRLSNWCSPGISGSKISDSPLTRALAYILYIIYHTAPHEIHASDATINPRTATTFPTRGLEWGSLTGQRRLLGISILYVRRLSKASITRGWVSTFITWVGLWASPDRQHPPAFHILTRQFRLRALPILQSYSLAMLL